jgi:hypothetical protein
MSEYIERFKIKRVIQSPTLPCNASVYFVMGKHNSCMYVYIYLYIYTLYKKRNIIEFCRQ